MKCFKCDMFTRTLEVYRHQEGFSYYLCHSCAAAFIQKLADWKDIELDEELDYWKSGKKSND